jgi:hypothetical protein
MALTSILLAFAAGLCIPLGMLATPFPVVGSLFSFGAPALAVLGIVLGARAMARARDGGGRSVAGLVGVVFNAMTLPPALGVALTCGAFNAALTSGNVQTSTHFQVTQGQGPTAGAGADTAPAPPPFAPDLLGRDAGAPEPEPEPAPAPAPALPPPPLPPE